MKTCKLLLYLFLSLQCPWILLALLLNILYSLPQVLAQQPLPSLVSAWLPSHPAPNAPHFSGKPSSTTAYLGFLRPMTKASRILRTSLGWMSLGEGGGSFSCDFPSTRLPSFSALRSSGSCSGDTDARNQCGQRCKGNYGWRHASMSV